MTGALRLQSITKTFGGLKAVADLTMRIEPGSITALIGPNGAGKTTVVNLITGMLKPTSGQVLLAERDVTAMPADAIARAGVSRTFQNIRLLREATVLENVITGFHRHEQTSLFANLVGLPAVWRERREFQERAQAMLDRFGMSEFRSRLAGQLSYGHQRRVEIMRALAMSPDFLLLDEPVAGMNEVESQELGTIVREIAAGGIGVLLIEHDMKFVMDLGEIIYVVNSGQLIATGTPQSVQTNPTVIEAYLGS